MPQQGAMVQNIRDRAQGGLDKIRARTNDVRVNFQARRQDMQTRRQGGPSGTSVPADSRPAPRGRNYL